jgi:hypothetical protein
MPSSSTQPLTRFVFDWISFRLTLPATSNFMFVLRVFVDAGHPHAHVVAHAPWPSGPATEFEVTLQDPKYIRSLSDLIERQWPGSIASITGIEVAMDTYKRGADQFDLAELAVDRFTWMQYPTEGRWHLYKKKGSGQRFLDKGIGMSLTELAWQLALEWQLTDHPGWERRPVRFHVQVKQADRAGKVRLPQDKWRARFEVTLTGTALPWTDVRELRTADFNVFRPWFSFRKQAAGVHPALALALRSRGLPAGWQPGRRGKYRRPAYLSDRPRAGFPLKYRYMSDADIALTKIIYDRLRDLRGANDK